MLSGCLPSKISLAARLTLCCRLPHLNNSLDRTPVLADFLGDE